MLDQRGTRFAAKARDNIHGTCRQAGFGRDLGHAQHRQAGILGGLDHARIAGCQRTADRAAENLQRIIPGNDVAGHAMRLAPRQDGETFGIGNRFAMQFVARATVEFEVTRTRSNVGARLGKWLAAIRVLPSVPILRRDRVWPATPCPAIVRAPLATACPTHQRGRLVPHARRCRCRPRYPVRWRQTARRRKDRSSAIPPVPAAHASGCR